MVGMYKHRLFHSSCLRLPTGNQEETKLMQIFQSPNLCICFNFRILFLLACYSHFHSHIFAQSVTEMSTTDMYTATANENTSQFTDYFNFSMKYDGWNTTEDGNITLTTTRRPINVPASMYQRTSPNLKKRI